MQFTFKEFCFGTLADMHVWIQQDVIQPHIIHVNDTDRHLIGTWVIYFTSCQFLTSLENEQC